MDSWCATEITVPGGGMEEQSPEVCRGQSEQQQQQQRQGVSSLRCIILSSRLRPPSFFRGGLR